MSKLPKEITVLSLNTPNITDYAQARSDLLKNVKTPWALFLDTDEVLSSQLVSEINQLFRTSPACPAYSIPRRDIFLSRALKYGESGNTSLVRLARTDYGVWVGRVHERWVGSGRVGELRSPIIHTPHPTLASFIAKIDRYSTLAAAERYSSGSSGSLAHIFVYPLGKFVYNYLFRLGFLDGVAGLIHAIMMSFHSYLTWTKLYLLWQKK